MYFVNAGFLDFPGLKSNYFESFYSRELSISSGLQNEKGLCESPFQILRLSEERILTECINIDSEWFFCLFAGVCISPARWYPDAPCRGVFSICKDFFSKLQASNRSDLHINFWTFVVDCVLNCYSNLSDQAINRPPDTSHGTNTVRDYIISSVDFLINALPAHAKCKDYMVEMKNKITSGVSIRSLCHEIVLENTILSSSANRYFSSDTLLNEDEFWQVVKASREKGIYYSMQNRIINITKQSLSHQQLASFNSVEAKLKLLFLKQVQQTGNNLEMSIQDIEDVATIAIMSGRDQFYKLCLNPVDAFQEFPLAYALEPNGIYANFF
jgi:hypothetical protein